MISRLPKSARKHIRKKKAIIRREVLDIEKRNQEIKKMYKKLEPNPKKSGG